MSQFIAMFVSILENRPNAPFILKTNQPQTADLVHDSPHPSSRSADGMVVWAGMGPAPQNMRESRAGCSFDALFH